MIEITFENVSKNFGKTKALESLVFKIADHGVYSFIGPNGSGKTTILRILAGLSHPSKGRVYFSENNKKISVVHFLEKAGVVIAQPNFRKGIKGIDLLRITTSIKNVPESKNRIKELIDLFYLEDFIKKQIASYSSGMLQRLLLANALISDPEILILDEPMFGLDLKSQNIITTFIENLKKSGKHTVIMTSHDVWQADFLCDEVMFLINGKSDGLWKNTREKDLAYLLTDINNSNMIKDEKILQIFSINDQKMIVIKKDSLKDILSKNEFPFSSIHIGSKMISEYLNETIR
ncbi:MAG: ABC transporter ATP-binding protein [Thermoplasmata archaeon]